VIFHNWYQETHGARPALRMASVGVGDGGDDLDARVEKALNSRLVSGGAGRQNMPMTREEKKRYERLGEDLMDAVRENDAARVKQLCAEKGADPAFADEYGFSCLHLAAKRGYTAVVQTLVDLGADINQEGWHSENVLSIVEFIVNAPEY